jgi:hypothetical protein
LVGIERSGPTQGDYFKKKKNFGVHKKNPIPKNSLLIFAKKKSGSGSSAHPPGIQSPRPDHP